MIENSLIRCKLTHLLSKFVFDMIDSVSATNGDVDGDETTSGAADGGGVGGDDATNDGSNDATDNPGTAGTGLNPPGKTSDSLLSSFSSSSMVSLTRYVSVLASFSKLNEG